MENSMANFDLAGGSVFEETAKSADLLSLVPLLIIFLIFFLVSRASRTTMRFRITNALIAGIIYSAVALVLYQTGLVRLIAILIYAFMTMVLMKYFIDAAERRKTMNVIEFSQIEAINALGTNLGSFHHIFYSHEPVLEAFQNDLTSALQNKLGCTVLKQIEFKDVDRELAQPETRVFFAAEAPRTLRRTGFVLLYSFSRSNEVQSIRWWVVVEGGRDINKVFWRYVSAPVIVPFVLLAYIRRQYEPLYGVSTIYSGFFNSIDILSKTRELHYVTFETLIETLDNFGIDTSDLKQQKGDILNINVSGGQTSFGSIVQGALNKVTTVSRGAKP